MYYRLTDRVIVRADIDRTWRFFAEADNLPKITPPAMRFRVDRSPAGGIELDSLLDYTVRVSGIPVHWRTLIVAWTPPTQFIDLQLRGPYSVWHHRHTLTPVAGGVECTDSVTYKLPFGPFGRLVHPLLVRKQLLNIFRFRRTAIASLLGPVRPLQPDVEIRLL